MAVTWLEPAANAPFPPVNDAIEDGLLAAGGDLSSTRLLNAYHNGIFPWFNKDQAILWWSPDPRLVLFTDQIKISKSLKKTLRTTAMKVTFDRAFKRVMTECARSRNEQAKLDDETWIHPELIESYSLLHEKGYAHSVECWLNDELVGGLYGVKIGKMFFGESMFSRVRDSSKIALATLCQQLNQRGYPLIDCQVYSQHLESLGAQEISRDDFIVQMKQLCQQQQEPWDSFNDASEVESL